MSDRGNIEKMEVEVTADLIDYASNEMGFECHREDLFGREYLKVYGDQYRDLPRFKTGWLLRTSKRNQSILLDYCNISSRGYFYVSVVTNLDKLDFMCTKYLYDING